MPKKKRKLLYSRRTHDKRVYGTHVYTLPKFLEIVAARCVTELNDAKKRVTITSAGRYKYEPSTEYKKHYKKYCKQVKTN